MFAGKLGGQLQDHHLQSHTCLFVPVSYHLIAVHRFSILLPAMFPSLLTHPPT